MKKIEINKLYFLYIVHYNQFINMEEHFIKLTTQDCIHNGYQYKEGLNILDGEFNNQKICGHGGLYFCRKEYILTWINYGDKEMYYVWDVMLCDDSKIVDMYDKLKTDKFILRNKRYIWSDEEICKLAVQKNGKTLQYVVNQTEEICKLAVQQNGLVLEYVKNQTEEICKLAVRQHGYALQYVKEPFITEEICKLAVQKNGYALYYVKNQTEEICRLAVQQNRMALRNIRDIIMKEKIGKLL